MTSIESASEGRHAMCFSTTRRLLWFDDRNVKRPVLSLLHQRAFDRTLHVETVLCGPCQSPLLLPWLWDIHVSSCFTTAALTTLWSMANHLVTVYDVNYASSGHIHLYGKPWILAGSPYLDFPISGAVFFHHPAVDRPEFDFFQLSSRGSVWKTNVAFSDDRPTLHSTLEQGFEWTRDIDVLAQKANAMSEDVEKLGGREYLQANLRVIYESMFPARFNWSLLTISSEIFRVQHDAAGTPEEDAEAVYQTIEKMPSFWQDMNEPVENMLLT